jgi:hypothetical protein
MAFGTGRGQAGVIRRAGIEGKAAADGATHAAVILMGEAANAASLEG